MKIRFYSIHQWASIFSRNIHPLGAREIRYRNLIGNCQRRIGGNGSVRTVQILFKINMKQNEKVDLLGLTNSEDPLVHWDLYHASPSAEP